MRFSPGRGVGGTALVCAQTCMTRCVVHLNTSNMLKCLGSVYAHKDKGLRSLQGLSGARLVFVEDSGRPLNLYSLIPSIMQAVTLDTLESLAQRASAVVPSRCGPESQGCSTVANVCLWCWLRDIPVAKISNSRVRVSVESLPGRRRSRSLSQLIHI